MSDGTEAPSPKRIRDALAQGHSPVSAWASQAVGLLAGLSLLPGALVALGKRATAEILESIGVAGMRAPTIAIDCFELASRALGLTVPLLLVASATVVATTLMQTRGALATQRFSSRHGGFDLLRNLGALVSRGRIAQVARGLVLALCICALCIFTYKEHAGDVASLAGKSPSAAISAFDVAATLAKRCVIATLAFAVIDAVFTYRAWWNRLSMTRAELAQENKETDGNPEIKQARHRAHQEMLASITLSTVPRASVVVTNPTHLACALRYEADDQDKAPIVLASGAGAFASKVVEVARVAGVPVVENITLARALIELPVGEEIPEALYQAVAEVLIEVSQPPHAAPVIQP